MTTASHVLDRVLVLEMVRVTEAAAIAASSLVGRGDEKAADHVAVEAMREALNSLYMDGTVVIGEGERDEAPMLYIGEKVGSAIGTGPKIDIALDPLEAPRSAPRPGPMRWRYSQWPSMAACSTLPTSIWTRSRSARAIPKA
jgi:fructose-1,6-bisphosphatase II / sedoheptulose-1,7-bisphosphatase